MAKKEKINWDKVHEGLELQGKFDEYTTPFVEENILAPDENYVYLPDKLSFRFNSAFIRGIRDTFDSLVDFFAYGLRVKDKKKLKAVKDTGIFTVTSHFSFLDSLILSSVVTHKKKLYITVARHNNKKGFGGNILRLGGTMPLPDNLTATKNFATAIDTIMEKKGAVHFYAEKAMWLNYPKPRPLKKGAFSYAAKCNCPVVPIFYEIRPAKGFFKLIGLKVRVTAHVLDPIFPKEELSVKKNTAYLHEATTRALIDKYRECFGVTRDNIYNVDPSCYDDLDKETIISMSCGVGGTYDFMADRDALTEYLASHDGDKYQLIEDYYKEKYPSKTE